VRRLAALVLLLLACAPKGPPPGRDPYALPGEEQASGPGLSHQVAEGESWERLAEDYYGDPRRAEGLRRANQAPAGTQPAPGSTIFVPLNSKERDALRRRSEARAAYNRGLASAEAGDYADAILQFRAALERDEDFAAAHYNLGLVYRRSGQLERAVSALGRAVRLLPGRAEYHYALGATDYELGRLDEAEGAFRRALDADDAHLASLHALARLLDESGRRDEARELWRRYLMLDPDSLRGDQARRRLEENP